MLKNTILLLILLGLFIYPTGTLAQKPTDTLTANTYYKKAKSLLTESKLDSSLVYFKKALPFYEQTKSWESVASCYNELSEVYFQYSKYEESLQYAQSSLEISNKFLDKNNIEEAKAYGHIGQYYLKKVNLNEARKYFENAMNIFKGQKNVLGISKAHNSIGQLYIRENKFDQAVIEFNKAIKIVNTKNNPNLTTSYNNLAKISFIKGEYEESISFLKKAISIEKVKLGDDHPKVGGYYNNIGIIYEQRGEDNKALSYYKSALDIQLKISGENHNRVAAYYNNISNVIVKKGDYQSSIVYLEKAIKIQYNLLGENHPDLGGYYASISEKFAYLGNYQKALLYAKKAFNIYEYHHNIKDGRLAGVYNNLAHINIELGKYSKAQFNLDRAIQITKEIYGEDHSVLALYYTNLGSTYTYQDNLEKALEYYKKSEAISINGLLNNNLNLALNYLRYGELYLIKKEYDLAMEYHNKALDIYKDKFLKNGDLVLNQYNYIANIYFEKKEYKKALQYYEKVIHTYEASSNMLNNKEYLLLLVVLQSYEGKAKILKELYHIDKNIEYLDQSIAYYKKSEKFSSSLRNVSNNYQDKLRFSEITRTGHLGAIEAHFLRNKHQENFNNLSQAFYYSEKSKSNTLKDILHKTNANNFAGLPSDLIALERNLRIDKSYYQSKVNEQLSNKEIDSLKVSSYESRLFDVSRRQDSLIDVLEKNYPKYHELKYKNEVVSVAKIQQQLDSQTTLLEFYTTDSITYAFVVSKNGISVKELQLKNLDEKVAHLNKTITSNSKEYIEVAQNLYQEILLPIREELIGDELIIIPDGALWHLNFDLLLTQKDGHKNIKDLSYLLRDYAISYANSADLLFNTTKSDSITSEIREECLAFSFSDTTNVIDTKAISLATLRSTKDDLPGTRREIKAISEIINGQYFYGKEANEATFKENADRYNILHLALHGEVDDEKPQNSKLYFTKTKDSIEDGLLYAHELFALNIPADLVVLSACNTGSGKIANGEGLMSLGNSFQYAGAQSLLLSRWEIPDVSTPILMKYFYRNLKEGHNKAKALQQAKLEYLNTTEGYSISPLHWGSFYIMGNTEAIAFDENFNTIYWWIIGGVVAIITIFFFRRKRKEVKS